MSELWERGEHPAQAEVHEPITEFDGPIGVSPAWPNCGCRSGILWPMGTDDDNSHDWIERCDECETYHSDDEAAEALATSLGHVDFHYAWHPTLGRYAPYIDRKENGNVEPAAT